VTAQSRIEIPADHPAFAGHFPQFPVLPGAVLLDAALQIIQRARGIDLTQWKIASAKFLSVVRPGETLCLEHDAPKSGVIRFTIRAAVAERGPAERGPAERGPADGGPAERGPADGGRADRSVASGTLSSTV